MNRRKVQLISIAFAIGALALTLAACGASPASSDQKASENYATGSLMQVHENGQLEGVEDYSNKLCLSCHPRSAIVEANADYGGREGFNPHSSHNAAGDCISCHSVEGESVLTCNECHDAPLPDGWVSAERGSGPLHKLFS